MTKYIAFVDGGSRGNPGLSGYGVYVVDEAQGHVWQTAGILEHATCNEAEYAGLLALLEHADLAGWERVHVRSDSKLLVNQALDRWKVKAPNLKPLHARVRALIVKIGGVTCEWIPREQNERADALATAAMDLCAAD